MLPICFVNQVRVPLLHGHASDTRSVRPISLSDEQLASLIVIIYQAKDLRSPSVPSASAFGRDHEYALSVADKLMENFGKDKQFALEMTNVLRAFREICAEVRKTSKGRQIFIHNRIIDYLTRTGWVEPSIVKSISGPI